MPLIALEGVRYRYPEADDPALDGITAAVEPGQVILLRGPSGSGKSTLLRCLNGLVPHSTGGDFAGRVTVCGLDTRVHLPREQGARIGFVFQHPDVQVVLRLVADLGMTTVIAEHRVERIAPFVDRIWTIDAGRLQDQAPRQAMADGGARPPVVDLALRAGWSPIPLGLRDARVRAQSLPAAIPDDPPADGAGMVIARLDRLGYAYPGARAVQDVSLTLRRGQVTALMGRNGSGKTTLLRLIGGTLRPQRGRLHSEGRVAYVPQDADALLFAATVRDELRGQPEEVTAPFRAWLLRYPRHLSAG